MKRLLLATSLASLMLCLSGCFVLPLDSSYTGPPPRPPVLFEKYGYEESFSVVSEKVLKEKSKYTIRQIRLSTPAGETEIDFYETPQKNSDLILVFPVLGGRPILSRHFASYFARKGFDAAIVHRSNEFKKIENFPILEELFTKGVIRDRIALDYFEQIEGKKNFGSFGMSRGAINVAITAGVDERLQYNFMAMGGADLPGIFKYSDERRIKRYVKRIMKQEGMTREELHQHLHNVIHTDPKYLAQYIDARHTMLAFGICDTTVPFQYGRLLRNLIGNPRTVKIFSGHKTAVLMTQVIELLPPFEDYCILPPAYMESEAILFFREAFGRGEYPWQIIPWKILQFPINLLFQLGDWILPEREYPRYPLPNYQLKESVDDYPRETK